MSIKYGGELTIMYNTNQTNYFYKNLQITEGNICPSKFNDLLKYNTLPEILGIIHVLCLLMIAMNLQKKKFFI